MPREAKVALYTIFGTMVVFKVVTALWIIWQQPSVHGAAFLVLTNTVWVALVAVPAGFAALFWWRRIKVRRKRRRLIEAEWSVQETAEARR
ncbi:MAG TPA: hypothetical protein VG370_02640 [Chloroflexota bacterium]|jgi:type VI protein secretion system component VasK|nr:hypothetical protein [Chloroflexota bacterium]